MFTAGKKYLKEIMRIELIDNFLFLLLQKQADQTRAL